MPLLSCLRGGGKDTREQVPCFKVVLLGNVGAGKSAFFDRFVCNSFSHEYHATGRARVASKLLTTDDDRLLHVELWDLPAISTVSPALRRCYLGNAHGAVLVCDATDASSFQALHSCSTALKGDRDTREDFFQSVLPTVLVASKSDETRGMAISEHELVEGTQVFGLLDGFMTSALSDDGIDEAMAAVVQRMVECHGMGGAYGVYGKAELASAPPPQPSARTPVQPQPQSAQPSIDRPSTTSRESESGSADTTHTPEYQSLSAVHELPGQVALASS